MPDQIFGPLIAGDDVEGWATATLQTWAPDYFAWAERERGFPAGSLPMPASYVTSSDFERWPEEQLPSVLLLSTGLADEPRRDGRHHFKAKFALGVAVVVSARDQAETDSMAKLYVAVIRTLLLQHQSLGGHAQAVEWVDERYDALPSRGRRQLAAGQAVFRVEVADVTSSRFGPRVPSADPSTPRPDDPTAETVRATIDPEGLTP